MNSSLTFSLLINAAPFSSRGANTAYQFAKAVLAKDHKIPRIFFYKEGIYNSNCYQQPPQDEVNQLCRWQQLAENYGIELIVCVAAAQRRGVIESFEQQSGNLASGFKISGLGQLIEAITTADRFLVFNE